MIMAFIRRSTHLASFKSIVKMGTWVLVWRKRSVKIVLVSKFAFSGVVVDGHLKPDPTDPKNEVGIAQLGLANFLVVAVGPIDIQNACLQKVKKYE